MVSGRFSPYFLFYFLVFGYIINNNPGSPVPVPNSSTGWDLLFLCIHDRSEILTNENIQMYATYANSCRTTFIIRNDYPSRTRKCYGSPSLCCFTTLVDFSYTFLYFIDCRISTYSMYKCVSRSIADELNDLNFLVFFLFLVIMGHTINCGYFVYFSKKYFKKKKSDGILLTVVGEKFGNYT